MVAHVWRMRAKKKKAEDYEKFGRQMTLPALRKIKGCQDAHFMRVESRKPEYLWVVLWEDLDALEAARVPYCVASSGEMEKMDITLGSSGLMPRVAGRIYNSAMVARGKPAPDLFLYAAKSMGAQPAACVVVEDSVAGVSAGIAAGMRVMAYAAAAYTDREGMRRAGGELFDDMAALPRLIGVA